MIARYARPEMRRIWSEEGKLARWFDVELAALDAWVDLGAVPAADVVLRPSASASALLMLSLPLSKAAKGSGFATVWRVMPGR